MGQDNKGLDAVIGWMKSNSSLAIAILMAIIIGIYIYQSVPPSAKIEELKIEKMRMEQLMDEMDDEYDQLLDEVDSLVGFIEKKDLNWSNEIKEIKKRNRRIVPKARDKVIDSDVDEQLMWWYTKRSNANPYEGE